MRVALRPATADDIARLVTDPIPYRVRAVTAHDGDTVLGIGGLVYRPDGVWASALITDEGRRYKAAIGRAARVVLAMARRCGVRSLYARAEPGRPGADALLAWLGFEQLNRETWVWRS